MDIGSLIGGVGGLASAFIGGSSASQGQRQALAQALAASDLFKGLSPPDAKALQVQLQQYVSTGRYTPQLLTAVKQHETNMSKVQTDPGLRSAQLTALKSLQDIGARGGRTLDQDAYLNKVTNDVNAANKGRVGAIQSSFAQRGMGQPGGLELEAQMENAQAGTARESDASMQAARDAQKTALQAIQQAGSQAGAIRGQDFDQQSQVAKAQDQIDRFNTAALNAASNTNVQTQNDAQLRNLNNSQSIANANTGVANQQKLQNAGAVQQAFVDQLGKTTGEADAMNGVGAQQQAMGQSTANMWGNIGQGVAKIGSSFGKKASASNDNSDEEDTE